MPLGTPEFHGGLGGLPSMPVGPPEFHGGLGGLPSIHGFLPGPYGDDSSRAPSRLGTKNGTPTPRDEDSVDVTLAMRQYGRWGGGGGSDWSSGIGQAPCPGAGQGCPSGNVAGTELGPVRDVRGQQ